MNITQGMPVLIRIRDESVFVWWGQDAEDERFDLVATRDSQVVKFRSIDQARRYAKSRSWTLAPEEELNIIDVGLARKAMHKSRVHIDPDLILSVLNFADDVRHSLGRLSSREGLSREVYEKFVESSFPYLQDHSVPNSHLHWTKIELNRLMLMFEKSTRFVETSIHNGADA